MTTVVASEAVLDTNINDFGVLKIPVFDPKYFVAIALCSLNATTDVWGTTANHAATTVTQIVGPIYPHGSNIDKN
jgi:hypothetical protein